MRLADCLTKNYLQKLDTLQIDMRYKLQSGFFGTRKAAGKGNSIEFSDFRQYEPGDDSRRIDWNSYARFDRLFVKQFTEERQANVNVFLDVSRSMDFGEGVCNKLLYAKLIAASVAYIGLSGGERVNLLTFSDFVSCKARGLTAKRSFHNTVELLDGLYTEESTGKGMEKGSSATEKEKTSFAGLSALKLGNGVSVVVSDFFLENGYEMVGKALMSQKQSVVFVNVLTAEEILPVAGGKFKLIDSETGGALEVALDGASTAAYEKALSEYRQNLENYCSSRDFRYIFTSTADNALSVINKITACK